MTVEIERAVLEFSLECVSDIQEIDVPLGSRVVHVHEQAGIVCVWVEVEISPYADHHPSKMRFLVVPTRRPFVGYKREPAGDWENAGEISTYAHHRGAAHVGGTVWHVYELTNQA
ncbi:MAG: hypothetical protein HOV97_05835 [Nonomuraea sp.]|nr:hypothetical protein [Nonomuraea sp.]